MGRIRNVAVVGMGALGLLFGQRIRENLGDEHLLFLMDEARKKRHSLDEYRINGKAVSFRMASPDEMKGPFDLIIVATKYSGLYEARDLIRTVVGPDTVIVSLLNGISSEKILAEVFEREQIIDCVAIGMDAVREGTSLTYQHMGRWQVGSVMKEQDKNLADLTQFLDTSGIEYEVCSDIRRAMWNKFMINVGINQTCMVYETNYGGATNPLSRAYEDMEKAMHEVIVVAKAEGIDLTEEDFEKDIRVLRSLNPEGTPSMRQDALAGRPSEVELFAGIMLRIAAQHGIDVPVNRRYYNTIIKMEKGMAMT